MVGGVVRSEQIAVAEMGPHLGTALCHRLSWDRVLSRFKPID